MVRPGTQQVGVMLSPQLKAVIHQTVLITMGMASLKTDGVVYQPMLASYTPYTGMLYTPCHGMDFQSHGNQQTTVGATPTVKPSQCSKTSQLILVFFLQNACLPVPYCLSC